MLLLIPGLLGAAVATYAAIPRFAAMASAKVASKAFDYSLFRAAKEILYIPLSYDARYRAKQVIDAFAYRFSKGATAGVLSLATAALCAIPGTVYAVAAGLSALIWAGVAVPLTAAKSRRSS